MGSKKVVKKVKNAVVNLRAFPLASAGYVGEEAKGWVRSVYRNYRKALNGGDFSVGQVRWAVNRGFLPSQVEKLGITEENLNDTISAKDYAYLRPLNGIYSKWISDLVTVHTIFKPFRDVMPKCYFQINKRYKNALLYYMENIYLVYSFSLTIFALISSLCTCESFAPARTLSVAGCIVTKREFTVCGFMSTSE